MRLIAPSRVLITLITLAILLAACGGGLTAEPTAAPTEVQQPSAVPTATATPPPPRELDICLGQEPQSLYIYASSTRATWAVLEALYDGPIDVRGYQDVPVILENLPDAANGGWATIAVPAELGQLVVAADGSLATLDRDVSVLPAGCADASCAVVWDGQSELELAQAQLTFRLLPGLTWSDGVPLTSADVLFSFNLASDPATPVNRDMLDRTASLEAPDALTVVWRGIPGYQPARAAQVFFHPLPAHLLSGLSASDILALESANRAPLGWGPYIIEEWLPGDSLRLRRNPNYFRAAERLPYFDILTYHFLGEPADGNIQALLTGTCDIVDQTTLLETQLEDLARLQSEGKIQVLTGLGPQWEQLSFGINLAAYDRGYSPFGGYRQDLLGDVRVRQAIAACIDRATLATILYYGYSQVPASFFPPDHPLYNPELTAIPFDPQAGMSLLDEAGWLDLDADPATPRTSLGVSTVLNNTPLAFSYLTIDSDYNRLIASEIIEGFGTCGIGLSVAYLNPADLYAAGPEGPLFGRSFDLAQFSWYTARDNPCGLYTSSQIPAAGNAWLGGNITGYRSADYDTACAAALRPDVSLADHWAVQALFAGDLPALPLVYRVEAIAARTDMCALSMDVSARSGLWNLEALDYGECR